MPQRVRVFRLKNWQWKSNLDNLDPMELTQVQETDGTVVARMHGELCFSSSIPHLEKLRRLPHKDDFLVGLIFQQKDSTLTIYPGDGPAIADTLSHAMLRFRKGAILAVICPDPLNYLRHQEIQRHMELPRTHCIRVFLDESSARQWLAQKRQNLSASPLATHSVS